MNDLVFKSNGSVNAELYTTGDVVAKYAGLSHHAVNSMINKYKVILDRKCKSGHLAFQMQRTKAGREKKVYFLNEKQSSFLITLLKNTPRVVAFKDALNEAFYAMKEELMKLRMAYMIGKRGNKSLGDAIKASEIDMHGKEYVNFANLIYRQALGVDGTRLKKLWSIPKGATVTQYLTEAETKAVSKVREQTISLLGLGLTYKEIKSILARQGVISQVTLKVPERVNTSV